MGVRRQLWLGLSLAPAPDGCFTQVSPIARFDQALVDNASVERVRAVSNAFLPVRMNALYQEIPVVLASKILCRGCRAYLVEITTSIWSRPQNGESLGGEFALRSRTVPSKGPVVGRATHWFIVNEQHGGLHGRRLRSPLVHDEGPILYILISFLCRQS